MAKHVNNPSKDNLSNYKVSLTILNECTKISFLKKYIS